MTPPDKPETRREFIRALGRTAALGAVVGGGIVLAGKSASNRCHKPTGCRACSLLGRCDLPEARQAMKRKDNE